MKKYRLVILMASIFLLTFFSLHFLLRPSLVWAGNGGNTEKLDEIEMLNIQGGACYHCDYDYPPGQCYGLGPACSNPSGFCVGDESCGRQEESFFIPKCREGCGSYGYTGCADDSQYLCFRSILCVCQPSSLGPHCVTAMVDPLFVYAPGCHLSGGGC